MARARLLLAASLLGLAAPGAEAQNLQDPKDKRVIRADDKLRPVFGKDSVNMFELAGIVGKHLA